jgi:hypothetical protein
LIATVVGHVGLMAFGEFVLGCLLPVETHQPNRYACKFFLIFSLYPLFDRSGNNYSLWYALVHSASSGNELS